MSYKITILISIKTGSLIVSSVLTTIIIMSAVSPTTSDDKQNVLNRDILFDTVSPLILTAHNSCLCYALRFNSLTREQQ